jgi:hypothetical protein
MPFDSYADLKVSVAAWVDNDSLTSVIPDFIRLGELRLQRDLKLRFTEVTTLGNLVALQDYLTLPTGCIEPIALVLEQDADRTVSIVAESEFTRVKNAYGDTGIPLVAQSRGLTLALAPTPSSALAYRLRAWHGITPLSVTVTTNWLLQQGPDALLFASLVEAGIYMGSDERLATWQPRYDVAMSGLRRQEFRARTGGGPLRMRSDGLTP